MLNRKCKAFVSIYDISCRWGRYIEAGARGYNMVGRGCQVEEGEGLHFLVLGGGLG